MKRQKSNQTLQPDAKRISLRITIAKITVITAICLFSAQTGLAATGTVDYNTVYQQIEGFGGAICYDASNLTGRSDSNTIYDYLFRDLGLDIFRIKNTYDFDSDNITASANIFTAGKSRNPALKTELVPWSPPTSLKSTGQLNSGTLIGGPSNYAYDDYATWWVNSINAWNTAGVYPDYLSIQNEPDWLIQDQVCRFDPTETSVGAGYDQAFEHVYQALYAQWGSNMPKMIGPESTGFSGGSNGAPRGARDYIDHFINLDHVYAYSVHLYGDGDYPTSYNYPDDFVAAMDDFATDPNYSNKPLHMTEWIADGTPTLDHAVKLAWHIHNCLYHLGVSAYYHWTLYRSSSSGGMINVQSGLQVRDLYWFFKAYAYYTDPNWYVLECTTNPSDNLRMSAFKDPNNSKLTVVVLNKSTSSDSLTLNLQNCTPTSSAVYRSSSSEHWVSLGSFSSPITLPAQSITTISFNVTTGGAQQTLTCSATTGGTVIAPGIGNFQYGQGSNASIVATANQYYSFANWTGSAVTAGKVASPTSASTTVLMDANYTVVANFTADTTAPTPDPMTWATVPTTTGQATITMTATTATDAVSPPVQYYFECTTDGSKSSGWQSSATYVASGLTPNTLYSFRVRARDSVPTANVTGWSSTLSATTNPPDTTPPTPNPLTWATVPTATGQSTITMTATTATDANTPPVQYYFECTTDGSKTSGWQSSPTYIATGLASETLYTFRVKARDSVPTPNVTGWSSTLSATTLAPPTNIEILGAWVTGLTHAKETGNSRALIFITHAEYTISGVSLDSVTYGGQTMTKVVEQYLAGPFDGVYVAAFVLNDANIVAADSSGTFSPSWTGSPSGIAYSSVFLANVGQTVPVGASASGSGTSNPTATAALSTNNGDMVIEAAACSGTGTFTLNSNFSLVTEYSMTSSDGVDGYKLATGVSETPSVSHSSSSARKVIIGFVVKVGTAPTGLVATAGNQTVSLDWSNNPEPDMNGYNVYRSTTQGSGYAKLNSSLLTSSDYIDNGLTNGITYYYVVTAVDVNNQESDNSSEVSATPNYQSCSQVIAAGHRLGADISGSGNCYVDFEDLDTLVNYWLNTGCTSPDYCEGADFEPRDGIVDFFDFGDFAGQWMQCNNPQDANCIENW